MNMNDETKAEILSNKIVCPGCNKIGNKYCIDCNSSEWNEEISERFCPSCNTQLFYGKPKQEKSCPKCVDKHYFACNKCNRYICGDCC